MTRAPELVIKFGGGENIALLSDAGPPSYPILAFAWSTWQFATRSGDPGSGRLSLSGGSCCLGVPVDKFRFSVPRRQKSGSPAALEENKTATRTLGAFMRLPHRILEMLRDVRASGRARGWFWRVK